MSHTLSLGLLLSAFLLAPLGAHGQATPGQAPSFKRGVNVSHWLAQIPPERYGNTDWFNQSDMQWIAGHGYDHVRIPVDGRLLIDEEGRLIEERMMPFDDALLWARDLGLGVIFDMHYLEGANFVPVENALLSNPRLQARAVSLWRQIAEYFRDSGPELRFEVLNEAVADENEQLNALNARLVEAIRAVSPDRVLYVSSNRYGAFSTADDVRVFDDPAVAYTFHYYEPFIFTHQHASWTELPEVYDRDVEFPVLLSDLDRYLPPDHSLLRFHNKPLDRAFVQRDFEALADWAKEHGAQVLIGEFGVYERAPRASARRWVEAVRESAELHGFGWTVWDYKGGFAVRDEEGEPTVIHEALHP